MNILVLCDPNSHSKCNSSDNNTLIHRDLCVRVFDTLVDRFRIIEFCDTVSDLVCHLSCPQVSPKAIVLVLESNAVVDALVSEKRYLDGIPVIVIWAGSGVMASAKVHALGPRFISHDPSCMTDVKDVLVNIAGDDFFIG